MQQFAALVAFGVTFLVLRVVTTALLQQISPQPLGMDRWRWWGTYVSILISLAIATTVMAAVDRKMRSRPPRQY